MNLFPVLSYVFISTFTPGPSNISSMSMAVLHGYRNTLRYQLGLAAGVFLLMFLSGWFSAALLNFFPALEPVLRYAGAAYILYLAFLISRASYAFTANDENLMGFPHGFMLNVLNPKLVVYAFTLFTSFLPSTIPGIATLMGISFLLAAVSFGATSTWSLLGSVIKKYLHRPVLRTMVNITLCLLLVYSAASLIGLV